MIRCTIQLYVPKLPCFGRSLLLTVSPSLAPCHRLQAKRGAALARAPAGSRLAEALLESEVVAAPTRAAFLDACVGQWAALAADKFGSHVVDKAFKAAGPRMQRIIHDELQEKRQQLVGSQYGKHVLRNVHKASQSMASAASAGAKGKTAADLFKGLI